MPRPTLEEIKAKSDEYAKLAKQIARAETAREAELGPIAQRHAEEMQPVLDRHDGKIERLYNRSAALRAEVVAWIEPKQKNYAAESELTTFGVEVGIKQLERQPDKQRLFALCKKKGVEFFDLVSVMLAEADKRLGRKEIDEISTRRTVPTRDVYVRLK